MKNIRRRISLLIALVMIISCFSPFADFALANEQDNIQLTNQSISWTEEDFFTSGININGLTLKGVEKLQANKGVLEIPLMTTSHGNAISQIAGDKFKNLGIKKLIISEGITEIGSNSFYGNEIEELDIPASVKEIKPSAFAKNNIRILNLSEGLEIIYPFAFEHNKISEVKIPDSVSEIRKGAFDNNKGSGPDEKVTLIIKDPTKVEFKFEENPENKYIIKNQEEPNQGQTDVFSAEDFTFKNVEVGVPDWTGYPDVVYSLTGFSDSGLEKIKTNKKLVLPVDDGKGNVPIWVENDAFKNIAIDKVEIPGNYTHIQFRAFQNCGLNEVVFSEGLLYANESAFENNNLTEVKLPSTFKYPASKSFKNNKLNTITLPDTCETIGEESFMDNNLTSIGLGSKTKIIYGKAFANNQLTEVNIPKNIKRTHNGIRSIYADAFDGNSGAQNPLNTNEKKVLLWTPNKDNPHNIPNGNNYIIDPKVGSNEYLPEDFECQDGLVYGFTRSGEKKLDKLKNQPVKLPSVDKEGNKITGIGEYAFQDIAYDITSIVIPEGYTSIEMGAFMSSEIAEVAGPSTLETIDDNAFLLSTNVVQIKVSQEVANKITNTSDYWELVIVETPQEAEDKTWKPEDFTHVYYNSPAENEIKITGLSDSGKEKQKTNHDLVIPAEIESKIVAVIGKNAFINRTFDKSTQFTSVVIPESLRIIEDGAFTGNALKGLTIPNKLETIEQNSFAYNEITELSIPESVKNIGLSAFSNNKITKVEIDNYKDQVNLGFEVFTNNGENSDQDIKPIFLKVKEEEPVNEDKWLADDFTYGNLELNKINPDGSKTPMDIYAVTGFSDKGLEKIGKVRDLVLPKEDTNGKKVEAVKHGHDEKAFRGKFGNPSRFDSLTIPEGYKIIDSMSFAFNYIKGELVIPESMEFIFDAAFFRNEFTSLVVGSNITQIEQSMMRGNKLKTVTFKGDIESIGRLAFAENKIEEIRVPDSLKEIGEQAFTTNTGMDQYENKVVIRTQSGNNPKNLEDAENYIIDPKEPGTSPEINYDIWSIDDFDYEEDKLVGFSKQGLTKIRRNKNLVIPDKTPSGKDLKIIGYDAFRNLNQGFDIERVVFPDTIVEIEAYAFQFNDISNLKLPRDLKTLGIGVFMLAGVENIEFNEKLEYIDQACFYGNSIKNIEIPVSVKTIMNAAFRGIGLESLSFGEGSNLEIIEGLAFADNKLSNVIIPNKVTKIGSQAFGDNKFTSLDLPASIELIEFQAFINNPGIEKYGGSVVLNIPTDSPNIEKLTDDTGGTFVINPEIKANDLEKAQLKKAIELAEKVNIDKLTESFKEYFEAVLADAKDGYNSNDVSKTKVKGLTKDLNWAVNRSRLNTLMYEKELLDPNLNNYEQDKWEVVEGAYEKAKKSLMTINISDDKLEILIRDLDTAIKSLDSETDPLKDAKAYEGEATVPKTHFIESYIIKMKVWVKDGRIVYIEDNGTVTDDPQGHEDSNKGYYEQAIGILNKYIDKEVDEVLGKDLGQDLGIDAVTGATVSSDVIHQAIKNALKSEPETPEDPAEPETPEDPTEPETPEDPTEPETPEDPAEPETPEDPTEPGTTEDPTEPGTTEDTTKPVTPGSSEEDTKPTRPSRPSINYLPIFRSALYDDKKEDTNKARTSKVDINNLSLEKALILSDKTIFKIDDNYVEISIGKDTRMFKLDGRPFISNDRTMLPLRYVANSIGAEVSYIEATRTAVFEKDNIRAEIQIDGNIIKISDGREIKLEAKPTNIDGRIYIPLTNVSQIFNLTNGDTKDGVENDIEWDGESRTVIIELKK